MPAKYFHKPPIVAFVQIFFFDQQVHTKGWSYPEFLSTTTYTTLSTNYANEENNPPPPLPSPIHTGRKQVHFSADFKIVLKNRFLTFGNI